MAHIAFIGLGVMGFPMAGHLARVGHAVTVTNRTFAKAKAWTAAHKGKSAKTPREAVRDADFVCVCVGEDADLREVLLEKDGAFSAMRKGATLIDHTTASAEIARELAIRAKKLGLSFLDAPVSGGEAGAQNGSLTVMVGGEKAAFDNARPILKAYAHMILRMGDAGSGQLTKMVNQICAAGLIEALAEGLNFGQCAGLDMEKVVNVIAKGAAQSWQMDHRAKTMLYDEFDFGFAVKWMRKDLGICFHEAEKIGARLPVTEQVDRFYGEISEMGGARLDTSSLIQRLRKKTRPA